MEKNDHFDLVVNQIFIGLGGGLGGAILFTLVTSLVYGRMDLFGSIMYAFIGCYFGMLIAIVIVGYYFLRANGREKELIGRILKSILGLAISSTFFYVLITLFEKWLPQSIINSLANWVMILIPLLGLILGFNFRLRRDNS